MHLLTKQLDGKENGQMDRMIDGSIVESINKQQVDGKKAEEIDGSVKGIMNS